MSEWMIYGANGYTGELCAREAVARGLKPVLAGRREEAVAGLASELGLDCRVFSLDDPGAVAKGLDGMSLGCRSQRARWHVLGAALCRAVLVNLEADGRWLYGHRHPLP